MTKKSPKKSLGQHFLTSHTIAEGIVEDANIHSRDTVVEIGPGQGILTEILLEQAQRVVALEKDHELMPELENLFRPEIEEERLVLCEADALEWNPCDQEILKEGYKVVANIPYYISGA